MPKTPKQVTSERRRRRLAANAKKGVKGGAAGESIHKRATDSREARNLLLGTPSHRRTGRLT